MSYNLHWNPKHPGHIVYLIDLSGSMAREINGRRMVDIVINDVIKALFRALRNEILNEDDILDMFSITVIGYHSDVIKLMDTYSAVQFNRFMKDSLKRGHLFNTGIGGDAEPKWQTYMGDAFEAASTDIKNWIDTQGKKGLATPAPVVINITDGDPYEGNSFAYEKALAAANRLKNIRTPDGNTLLFNIHFSPDSNATRVVLPSTPPQARSARFLYEASSIIPPSLVESAKMVSDWQGSVITSTSKAMVSNEKNTDSLLRFIQWGTSTGGVNAGMENAQRQYELPKPE